MPTPQFSLKMLLASITGVSVALFVLSSWPDATLGFVCASVPTIGLLLILRWFVARFA